MDYSSDPLPGRESRLLIPGLAPLYRVFHQLYWPLIRVTVGGTLLAHGINKLMGPGVSGVAGSMTRVGIEPAIVAAAVVILLETVGAVCIILGLFTRFFAAAISIELAVITFAAHFPNGWGWTSARGGWEYPFLWGLIFFAIAMRGGGPMSLDRKIGHEL